MKIKKTKIRDLLLIEPRIYKDRRGYFFESYNSKEYKKYLLQNKFVQDDHSFSKKNVLRGIHFQHKNPQSQLLYLVTGELFYVFIDLRPKSKTFLKKIYFNFNSKKHMQIYQPPGVASGYYVLSKYSHLIYKISKFYDKTNEMAIMWNDKTLKIKWPCKRPILSNKDKKNCNFIDIKIDKFKDLLKL